ncbi:Serine protease snake, partial [Blattella germanica]
LTHAVVSPTLGLFDFFSITDFFFLAGESCKRNDGSEGECKHFERCPSAKDEINTNNFPAICGFQDRMPIVCCKRQQTSPTKPPVSNAGNAGSKSKQNTGVVPLLPVYEPPKTDKTKTHCSHGAPLILGGVPADPKEFPHMRFVLTAAHCTSARGLGAAKWIRLGELNLATTDDKTQVQDFAIEKIIRHPDYASPAHYNDIALIQIDRNATFDGFVRPACIHTEESLPGNKFIASGWGLTDWIGSKGSDELLKVALDLQDPSSCNETFAPLIGGRKLAVGVTPESMLCVGDLNGGKDTCKGDSGGPLQVELDEPFCMYDVIGITSFGSICGAKNSPAIYTRVSHYIPWIESVVWP